MAALILMVGGFGLIGYSLLSENSPVSRAVSTATSNETAVSAKDTTFKLTVPKMGWVKDLPVYDAPWDNETALEASALHPQGTGFPWQAGSNVYIADHRMGLAGHQELPDLL